MFYVELTKKELKKKHFHFGMRFILLEMSKMKLSCFQIKLLRLCIVGQYAKMDQVFLWTANRPNSSEKQEVKWEAQSNRSGSEQSLF